MARLTKQLWLATSIGLRLAIAGIANGNPHDHPERTRSSSHISRYCFLDAPLKIPGISAPQLPDLPVLPYLPEDVWKNIALHTDPRSFHRLGAVSREHYKISSGSLEIEAQMLWNRFGPSVLSAFLGNGLNVDNPLRAYPRDRYFQLISYYADHAGSMNVDWIGALVAAVIAQDFGSFSALIQVIEKHGVDCQHAYSQAMHEAAKRGNNQLMLHVLLDKTSDRTSPGFVQTFVTAVRQGSLETLHLFVSKGTNVNVGDGAALLAAIQDKLYGRVRMLLDFGADPNIRGQAPLKAASELGDVPLFLYLHGSGMVLERIVDVDGEQELLLENDVVVEAFAVSEDDEVEEEPWTPLILAARYGHKKLVDVLVDEFFVDLHAHQDSALMEAIRHRHVPVIEKLLQKGADGNAQNGAALKEAILQRNGNLVRMLLQFGANVNVDEGAAMQLVALMGDTEMLRMLVSNEGDLYRYGCKTLKAAIVRGNLETLRWLLEQRAVDRCDVRRLVESAQRRGFHQVVWMLRQYA